VSISFDPSKLICVCCGKDHAVAGKEPNVVLLPTKIVLTLAAEDGKLINIVRVDNTTLRELLDFAKINF
jgi:hypothetical protein